MKNSINATKKLFTVSDKSTENIKLARMQAGHTQAQAAQIIRYQRETWTRWESDTRGMRENDWELYLIKTGQLKES